MMPHKRKNLATRFRGFLPVVIDVETGGLNPLSDPILEIAAVFLKMDEQGVLSRAETIAFHVEPFLGAHLDPEALKINNIDPSQPLRLAVTEQHALHQIFCAVKKRLEEAKCQRAVLVGHNAWFDLGFLVAAASRSRFESHPFHSFTSFDTATLSGLIYGETVLAKALRAAKISFDLSCAHSAIYDAEKTAELFCAIHNALAPP